MTEYWVSKKQYWCKYCSVFIRDDAPSRRSHETGLKHSGNKERFIRDLYKNGNRAKIEKAEEAVQIARIEAAAAGTGATASRLSTLDALRAQAPSHKAREPSRSRDKFADYSSAKDLGLIQDEETEKTSYEVEQELKGRAGEVGAWETVEYEPTGYYTEPAEAESSATGAKRKLGEYKAEDETHEGFRIQKKKDPYGDDDWDPAAVKLKKEEPVLRSDLDGRPLDWEKWQRPSNSTVGKGGWMSMVANTGEEEKPTFDDDREEEPEPQPQPEQEQEPEEEVKVEEEIKEEKPEVETSLFKKRRPPPSSRKK